eukprot:TRINITY_DN2021_c0_g1_i21.p1 TRINITY_DN2021_c0_g1~~TRINITY_DN2021_c0_g1_i21.p1  ORF type:complete len:173 (-),score=47.34 TRINITY_DN2021_c0_g1_i21:408-926(-)
MLRYPGVVHAGDNLTGEGEGDDEQISLDLQTLAAKNIWTVLFVVNIYNRTNNPVNFGMVDNEFCRLVDLDRKTEMCRYELDDMGYVDTANTLVMCKLFRVGANNNVWRMQALGTAFQGPPTALELAKTDLLEQYAFKLPVYSPIPAPDKSRRRRAGNRTKESDKSGGCCIVQ